MKQQKMARLQVFVMIILHLILTSGSLRVDHPLPFLPSDFYSGFVEGVFTAGKQGPRNTNTAISLKWAAYDKELQLVREDGYEAESALRGGAVSRVEDWHTGVVYTISRQSHDCVIQSLYENSTLNRSDGEQLHMKTLWEVLSISRLNYTYAGTEVIRSVLVDTWSFQPYDGSEVMIAFTRPGTLVETIESIVDKPILWQFSVRGNDSSNYFSTVLNFYGLSYNKPKTDVFDTSVCFSSSEYEPLMIQIPGRLSEVDVDHLQDSIRLAFANYTDLYLLQVGGIEILKENATFILVSLKIFNLTSVARVGKRVSAYDAVQVIKSNLSPNWTLPFSVELSPHVQVFPILYHDPPYCEPLEVTAIYTSPPPSATETHDSSSSSIMSYSPQTAVLPTHPITPTTVAGDTSVISLSPTLLTQTVASFLSLSASRVTPPPNTPQTIVHTVTETVTVSCSPQPLTPPMPTVQPHVTTECLTSRTDSPCSHGLSAGGAAGVAIGTFIAGIVTAFILMVLCVLCCNCCNRLTTKREGWQRVPNTNSRVSKEMDYFQ